MEQQYSFGRWLRLKRKALDLTREGLADRVGYSAATIRKLEAEERRPSIQIVDLFADIFDIPKEERISFLRFARGDWSSTPIEGIEGAPWRASSIRARTNLPAPPTAIIGRAEEIALVSKHLLKVSTRLVTLTGPPGIGKTRLSLEIGRELLTCFPDGVFFVALAPLDDPDLIAPTIVQALGFVEIKGLTQFERLKDGIADKQLLLVLDNLEHIVSGAAPLVADLLLACPHLKILATSREALRIPGEWLYPMPALEYPQVPQIQAVDFDTVSRFSALTLFEERARAVRPDFVLNRDNVEAVATICGRLDGLPLAIELVSARIRLMSPQTLLARLSDQLALHSDGMRALPKRQKTLHNAIVWSYDLLSQDEKQLFAYLSVFSGGFTLEAAEQIFSPASFRKPVTDLIASLLDKSLLQRTIDPQGEPRFNMLVTIQQFAWERLREWGEETTTRDMHLGYFLDLAERADQQIHGPDQVEWINRLEMDHENFRSALEWCVSKQNTQAALRLLAALAWPWWLRGHANEVSSWFDKINSLPEIVRYPALRARLLNQLGRQGWVLGDFSYARLVLEESRAIWLKLGVDGEQGLAETLLSLGMIARTNEGDNTTAQSLYEQSLELCQKSNHQRGKASVMFNLGWIAADRDQHASALAWCEQSLDLFRQLGDGWGIARASQILGQLYLEQGNYEKAYQYFEQHLNIDEELHFSQGTVVALGNLGNLYRFQGDYAQAELFYQKSLTVSREYDLKWDDGFILWLQGILALQRNDYRLACQLFTDYYDLARKMYDAKIIAGDLLIGLAAVAGGTDQPERAAKLNGAAHAILDTLDKPYTAFDQAEFDRHIRLAREQLGDATFEAHRTEGSLMSLEDAIAFALEDSFLRIAPHPDSSR